MATVEQAVTDYPVVQPDLDISLRHLFVFMAVAKAGNIAAAAENLSRASSAVARAVSGLEDDFGVRLFDRHARGMTLNAHGKTVLERVNRIAQELNVVATAFKAPGHTSVNPASQLVLAALPNGRRLAIVASLADRRNMRTVAHELSVTQATISLGLKELEDRLGLPLFTQSAKGLVATEAGELTAFRFRRSLSELRQIGPDLAAMGGVVEGTVRIGTLPLGRTRILPACIADVVARHPRLHIVTAEGSFESHAAQLDSGDIDFLFGALRTVPQSDIHQEPLFDDSIAVIARAGHPLASRGPLELRDLRDARWVLWRAESPSRQMLLRAFTQANETPPEPSVETGDLAILRGVVEQSDMLTATSPHRLHYEIAAGELVVLPVDLAETNRSIGLVFRRGTLLSPGTRALLDAIRNRVREMIDQGELANVAAGAEPPAPD
jgi:LysR family transcriptional regulator of gallate degradation